MSSVLFIPNEPLGFSLRDVLAAYGFSMEEVKLGEDPFGALRRSQPNLVLFDFKAPGLRGAECCKRVLDASPHSGIVVVANEAEEELLTVLEYEVDDYIVKPVRPLELITRLRAVERRLHSVRSRIVAGELELSLDLRVAWKNGDRIRLTRKEFDLLAYMMQKPGTPLTHLRLLRAVWGPGHGSEPQYVRTYIRRLRKKIENDPERPAYIHTESCLGYRFGDLEGDRPSGSSHP